MLTQPLLVHEQLRCTWLLEAQRRHDMQRVAGSRPKLRLSGHVIQWQWVRSQLNRLKLPADRFAALLGVIAGDAVPELTAARWSGRGGLCACGEPEDLLHRWWHCPRRHALRARALRGAKTAALAALPRCTKEHGIPVELPEVRRWRENLPQDRWQPIPSSQRYYTDGSCLRPRLPEVRVAAWAIVGRTGEEWWSRSGPCPGHHQTIGRAELVAICHVLCSAAPGTIVTDCFGVQQRCKAILDGRISKEELHRCTNADLWAQVWGPLRSGSGWQVEWLPSHRSFSDAAAAQVSYEDWLGNFKADEAAKALAHSLDASPQLLEQWADHQAATEATWRLIAESQVVRLAARPRRRDGTAAKSRKRKAPARPTRSTRHRVHGYAVEPVSRAVRCC